MKRPLLLSALLTVFSISAFSQITVTRNDFPVVGTSVELLYDTAISGITMPVGSSTAATWDFSTLDIDDADQLDFVNPSSFPSSVFFPSANLAFEQDDETVFLVVDASASQIDGFFGDIFDQGVEVPLNLTPNLDLIQFPATYGDAFNSSTIIDSTLVGSVFGLPADSVRITITFQSDVNIDGYGMLTTPSGTYDVLRVFRTENTETVAEILAFGTWQPLFSELDTSYTYEFVANGEDYPVLSVETDAPNGTVLFAEYQVGDNVLAAAFADDASCHGGNDGEAEVFAFGGTGNYTYTWSSGTANGSVATDLAPGNHSVTVSDGTSSVTENFTVNEPAVLVLSSASTPTDGIDNGTAQVTASGGTAPYSYSWSNGGSTSEITDLADGAYTVTVTDDNGCDAQETVNVGVTGIFESGVAKEFKVFPNPVRNGEVIQVVLDGHAQSVMYIVIFSLDGALVNASRIASGNQPSIQTDFPAGMYLMKLKLQDGTVAHSAFSVY